MGEKREEGGNTCLKIHHESSCPSTSTSTIHIHIHYPHPHPSAFGGVQALIHGWSSNQRWQLVKETPSTENSPAFGDRVALTIIIGVERAVSTSRAGLTHSVSSTGKTGVVRASAACGNRHEGRRRRQEVMKTHHLLHVPSFRLGSGSSTDSAGVDGFSALPNFHRPRFITSVNRAIPTRFRRRINQFIIIIDSIRWRWHWRWPFTISCE